MRKESSILLTSLRGDEVGYVETINGSNAYIGRMAALGLISGTKLTVLRNAGRLPLLVEVSKTFVALDPNEADRICVRRL